jgi:hypothetical protein
LNIAYLPITKACSIKGRIAEGPARGTTGDWECALERFTAGDNIVVVVIEMDSAGQPVVIITTYRG